MASHRSTMGPGSYYPGAPAPHGHEGGPGGNLSVADQLMQLDSAITSTLQEIDANFARAHQIVTATLLPAVKVYGQHSAKTWQSAKFWQDFFITAAQVPLKRSDEENPDADYDAHDQTVYEPCSDTLRQEHDAQYDLSEAARTDVGGRTRGDEQRGGGGIDDSDDSARFFNSVKHVRASSPPNASRRTNTNAGNDSEASWAPMESPFERLRKEVEGDYGGDGSMSHAEMRLAQHRANREARERALLDDATNDETIEVNRRDLAKGVGRLDVGASSMRSPAKLRPGNLGTPKLLNRVLTSEQEKAAKSRVAQNPFQQGGGKQASAGSSHWTGIADLRQTPLSTNKVHRSKATGKKDKSPTKDDFDSDEDSLAWPPGMSPPVTLQFSIPQSRYLKTPAKEATKLFMEDLLRTAEAGPATIARRKLAAEQAMFDEDDSLGVGGSPSRSDKGGAGVSLGTYKGKGVVGHSAVASPLKKGPRQKGGRQGDGPQKRRDSLPTPPTLTRTLPGRAAGQHKSSNTPGNITSSGSLLGSGQAGHRAAMLLDQGETGQSSDEDDEGGNMPELRPGPSSAFADVTPVGQGRRPGKVGSADEESDSESDSDDDEDSEDDSRVGVTPLPASTSKNLSTFSSNLSHSQQSEWTASSNSRITAGGNLDNDTLFGVGKSSRIGTSAGTSNASGASGAGPGDFRVIGGPLDNTVQGGELLADKDLTYSAPSPTPFKAD